MDRGCFLSPVHPHAIWSAWREITGRQRPRMRFWAIPAHTLAAPAAVLDRTSSVGDPIGPSEVTAFDPLSFRTAMTTPAANRAWLESLAARGASGAWFHGVPHVLVAGHMSFRGAAVIDWGDVPM